LFLYLAGPDVRSYEPRNRSDLARTNTQTHDKFASATSRPFTASLQSIYRRDSESEVEAIPISISRTTSGRSSNDRPTSTVSSSVLSQDISELPGNNLDATTASVSSSAYCIIWSVRLKVFAVQDENDVHQQCLAWRNEQRKIKVRRSSKQFCDV
jgi:hypothetical protein